MHDPVLAVLASFGKLAAKRGTGLRAAGGQVDAESAGVGAALNPTRYHKVSHNAAAIETLFVDVFLEAHRRPPAQIILDLDATDDPLHGNQEGRFFHGYYDCHSLSAALHLLWSSSAGGPGCGGRTSTAPPVRSRRWHALSRRSRRRWPKTRVSAARRFRLPAREALMAWCARRTVSTSCSAWRAMSGWSRRSAPN